VGFSQNGTDKLVSDETTAAQSLAALESFFTHFAEYAGREFYISGESYAGVYIPYLAERILKHSSINLKGVLIGNACTHSSECTDESTMIEYMSWYQMEQFNDHGFISPFDWEDFRESCDQSNWTLGECAKMASGMIDNIHFNYVDINNLNGFCYHTSG
jgi:serine carboxypeptidase-like clade 2